MNENPTERWRARLPFALVLLSLLALALIPLLVQRRIDDVRRELSVVAEPARGLVTEIQLALALELSGTRAFLLTGEEQYSTAHEEARARRLRALDQLIPLTRALDPRAHALAIELRMRLRPADALLDDLFDGRITTAAYREQLDEQQDRFRGVVATAAQVDDAIRSARTERLESITATERLSAVLTPLLVLLALIAALLVARLGRRHRLLAGQLATRSAAQAALGEVARELGASLSVRDAVQTMAERAVSTTHAFGAYVERAEKPKPGTEVEVVAIAGSGVPSLGTRVPYPGSLSEEIIESGEPQLMKEVSAVDERMAPYLRESCRGCSALIVPLTSEGDMLGALVLLRGAGQAHFTPEETAHARQLAALASAALRRVLLLEALSESEARFRQIADHLQEVIWLGDPDLTTRYYVNPAYEEVWGLSRESFYAHPRSPLDAVHPDDRTRVEAAVREMKGGDYDIEYRIVRPDGEVRWIWSRGYPIRNERGEVYRIAGIMEDITDQKAAEREREELLEREREARAEADRRREELERVTESRTRLMRGFSHDVKNPLGAADGHAQLLADGILGPLSDKQRESVGGIRRSIQTSLRLIQDLLELARAEAGQITIECVLTDIAQAAREVAEDFQPQATADGLALDVDAPGTLQAETDPTRVRQVLGNLLSNAVKYTAEGRVSVVAERATDGDGPRPGEWVAVHVTDTGPGIADENRERIFQEFTRLDPDAPHGAGVGLAISRRITRLLGGDITVESEVGRGSTFTLWLPRGGQPPA